MFGSGTDFNFWATANKSVKGAIQAWRYRWAEKNIVKQVSKLDMSDFALGGIEYIRKHEEDGWVVSQVFTPLG